VKKTDVVIEAGGTTVPESAAKRLVELVEHGTSVAEAERTVGMTLAGLRALGAVNHTVRGLLDRLGGAGLLRHENQNELARAVLVETMLQDEDLAVKVRAAKALIDADKAAATALVQVNATLALPTDPATLEALKSLQILTEQQKGTEDDGHKSE
jgi:hypothetical protein